MMLTVEMLHARAHAGMYPTYAAAAADMEAHAAVDERFTVLTMATSARMSLQCPVYVDLPDPDAVTFEFADLPPPLPVTAATARGPVRPNQARELASKQVNVRAQSAPEHDAASTVTPERDAASTATHEHDATSKAPPKHDSSSMSTPEHKIEARSAPPVEHYVPSKPLSRFASMLRRSLLAQRRSARTQECAR
ncbi:hypothetical protein C8Q78DRAFT_120829 [Trametes maxima]|nr:hypothetical protein C8Q78DRAFT_120829 [Trametes maxima]